jgi:aromatic ring-cleaving dioxygenase
VRVRRNLSDGNVAKVAIESPTTTNSNDTPSELEQYAEVLRRELDAFIDVNTGLCHEVRVIHDHRSAMVQVDLRSRRQVKRAVEVLRANEAVARKLADVRERMTREKPQWVHFDRNLFLYEGSKVFILKPMQRVHWLRSQALMDADEIIAETLGAEDAG